MMYNCLVKSNTFIKVNPEKMVEVFLFFFKLVIMKVNKLRIALYTTGSIQIADMGSVVVIDFRADCLILLGKKVVKYRKI